MPATHSIRILHLEDSPRDAELIQSQLATGGLACDFVLVDTKEQFEAALAGEVFDLILLDYNVAGYGGVAALPLALRSRPHVPVIIVSGTIGEEAAVECLLAGATDYILKQRPARLLPAVRRALAEAAERARRRQAEAEFRESETQLQRAQAVAQLGSWTFDVARGTFTCSPETFRIFGLTPRASLVFEDFLACVHPDDRDYLDRSWKAAVREKRPYDLVYRVLVGDAEKWVHERAELICDDAGRPVRAVGTSQDVTEREHDRNSLVASEHFIRATLSALQDPIVVLDGGGRILKTNQAWREFTGPSGLPAAQVHEGVDYLGACERAATDEVAEAATAADLIRDLLSGQRSEGSFEYACHSPQEERWFLCRGTRFQSGEQTRVVVTHTNITARRRAEEALRKLNAELEEIVRVRTAGLERANAALVSKEAEIRSIVDNILSCVIGINDTGIIHSANAAVQKILGYSVAEIIGQNVSMLMPEPHHSAHDGHIERYQRTGEAHIIGTGREVEGLHKDGSRITLHLSVNEYFIEGKRHFTGVLSDSRERIRILNELKQARDQAEQASRAKSEFLAAMSHEIRTPMNGVIGMIDVLHQSSLKGAQVEMVELIRESAYSLLTIINDILDYSKIEAGRLDIEQIPFPIEEVVERACMILDRVAQKAGVELILFIDPALPAEVLGDPNRLRQVLVNLLSNAIKFSSGQPRRAQVRVRAILTECSTEPVTVEFCVSDNGIGMDAATVSRLFSPFTQADASTTRRFGGTGLGLTISHNLVALMGGKIAVQSAVGQGSTFTVRLPFTPLAHHPDAREKALVRGLSCVVVGNAGGLADDLAAYLTHAGATVQREVDLGNAREHANRYPGGLSVWIIDTGDEWPTPDELLAQARVRPDLDLRLVTVAVERGQRRTPRRIAADVITVDGNVLRREDFLTAVAAAARRAPLEGADSADEQGAATVVSLSREQALRQGCLILVVEDNETNQKVILAQLRALGFTADVAGNGRDALQRWENCSYGLLLTDLHMPEMDGYELTTAIRARETGARHVPIVALTANALKGEADRCREAGMDDYLSKPVPLADLKLILERWLPGGVDATDAAGKPSVAQAEVAPPPVDISVLKALVGEDPAVLHDVLQDFITSAARIAANLHAACAAGESEAARTAAHKLKSSARAVGALALGELCEALENAGAAGNAAALAERLPLFDSQIAAVTVSISRMLASESGVRRAP
jgi:PAS domain S-box-containing protein